jgi:SDR family mycofactocin-dependent oxidoreductase
MTGKLEGKVAFVTGAARGQGRSHAVRLAEEGADIIAIDICKQIDTVPYELSGYGDLATTVELVKATGRRIIAGQADVRDLQSVRRLVHEGVRELGRLDIVAANAGIAGPGDGTIALSEQQWQDMIDVNLTGVWHTVKASVPHIQAGRRGGSVVLTSSAAGIKAYANVGHYVAAKFGVAGLMKTLAIELAPESIRVNSLHPTQVDTPMIMNDAFYRLFTGKENQSRADFEPVSQALNKLPVPWVEPVDISNALIFLVSDDARYITGVQLPVDAGTLLS